MLEKGWGQGTIEGAICSAVNLDNGVRDFFEGSEYELSYGDVVLAPALFQDDFLVCVMIMSVFRWVMKGWRPWLRPNF